MKDGKCSKKFPKEFINETQTGKDGYPKYRRRSPEQGGHVTKIRMKINGFYQEVEMDNRSVIPHNRVLSRIYKAHINVE